VRKCVSRAILDALEAGHVEEVDDELYEACAAQVSQEDGSSSWGYKLIDVHGEGHLALRVAAQIGGGLETGCVPWTGGCVFLGLALTGCLSTDLNGAGTGILGLGLALTGSVVTLTDAQPAVLENLRHNLEATRACAAK
ncbi:METTL21B, partial [Symbiodinium sp. CCMP2456]